MLPIIVKIGVIVLTLMRLWIIKDRNTVHMCCVNRYPFNSWKVGDYVEIDIDRTKKLSFSQNFDNADMIRKISSSEAATRGAMIKAASSNSEASSVVQDGINRINHGEIREFEYQIEDTRNNNTHKFIYRK